MPKSGRTSHAVTFTVSRLGPPNSLVRTSFARAINGLRNDISAFYPCGRYEKLACGAQRRSSGAAERVARREPKARQCFGRHLQRLVGFIPRVMSSTLAYGEDEQRQ